MFGRKQPKIVKKRKSREELLKQKQVANEMRKRKALPINAVQRIYNMTNIYHDGTVETIDENNKKIKRYARVLKFSDVNYQLASQEEQENVFVKYSQLITFFDPSVIAQITIINKEIDKKDVIDHVAFKKRNDKYDALRQEYNNAVLSNVFSNKKIFKRDKYLSFSVPGERLEVAKPILERIEQEMVMRLKQIGSAVEPFTSNKEVIETYHDVLLKHSDQIVWNDKTPDQYFKDYFSPMGLKMGMTSMIVFDGTLNEKHWAFLTVKNYPPQLVDAFISEISMVQFNTVINLSFRSMEQTEAINLILRKLTFMNTQSFQSQARSAQNGVAMVPPKLQMDIEDTKELLADVQERGQRLFWVSLLIAVEAESQDELKANVDTIRSIARKNGVDLEVIPVVKGTTKDALNSMYPMGRTFIHDERLMSTASTAIMIPFTSVDIMEDSGIYYGINMVSQLPIIFDRTELRNPNGFTLGTPGAGKSFSAKREIVSVFLSRDDDILVIDPEREYTKLAQTLGGTVVKISANTHTFINPLDMTINYAGGEDNPMALKLEFLLSLISMMMSSGKRGADLSPAQRSIIDKVMRKLFEKAKKTKRMPTLADFHDELLRYSGPNVTTATREIAMNLATSLEIYTTGSLSMFAKPTNVRANNRFVVYDIMELGNDTKTIGMLVVLDQIWNRITMNRQLKKRTWLYIDEIYLLFQNEYSSEYLYQLFKRSRKWGAVVTGLTQNVEDMLQSDMARTMLANADFLTLFNQSPSDIEILQKTVKLTDKDTNYILSSPPGQGLLSIDHMFIPFYDRFPKETKLYRVMTTKVEDIIQGK